MLLSFDVALTLGAAAVAAPGVIFAAECLSAVRGERSSEDTDVPHRIAVVVPAHDEELHVAATVRNVLARIRDGDRVIVVADNCSDATADLARLAGAEVIERVDSDRRGKGYAISFAVSHLRDDPPDVVVVVDADCRLEEGALDALRAAVVTGGAPVQADYLLEAPPNADAATRLSAFAVLVRNRVRPLGLARWGLPCQLTGSGMAFPWSIIESAEPQEGNIVEDLALGASLTRAGTPPRFCASARVVSELPATREAATTQRRRWESGQLATMLSTAPALIAEGLRRRSRDLVGLGLDLTVPPLALLVAAQGGMLVVTGAWGLLTMRWLPFVITASGATCVAGGVVVAWLRFGRQTLSMADLAGVPLYVARKLPLYAAFAKGRREREWVRTKREA